MYNVKAYAAKSGTSGLAPLTIPRRDPGERDVKLEVLFCGICHSDLHHVRAELPTVFPFVPGHEIVGRISAVGSSVTKHRVGDLVGIGCLVDTDRTCKNCRDGLEQFCPNMTITMGSPDKHGTAPITYGGYSTSIVVDEHFALRVPSNLNLAGAAPLLCAGITVFSPMRHHGVTKGQKVGVVGVGGLGHMGVKFARAFGAHVVAFTTSPEKSEAALRLGADEAVVSRDADAMKKHRASFDFILDTVAGPHDLDAYLTLLARDSTLALLGISDKPFQISGHSLHPRRNLTASNFGSIAETQEMLDFCGTHSITSDVEVIPMHKVNEAYDRLARGDVRYRFSIDIASLASA